MEILEREKRRRPALSGHDVDLSWAHAAESLFGKYLDLRFGNGSACFCNLSRVVKEYLQETKGESRVFVLFQPYCKVVQTWKEPLEGSQDARLQKVPQVQKPPALAPHQGTPAADKFPEMNASFCVSTRNYARNAELTQRVAHDKFSAPS